MFLKRQTGQPKDSLLSRLLPLSHFFILVWLPTWTSSHVPVHARTSFEKIPDQQTHDQEVGRASVIHQPAITSQIFGRAQSLEAEVKVAIDGPNLMKKKVEQASSSSVVQNSTGAGTNKTQALGPQKVSIVNSSIWTLIQHPSPPIVLGSRLSPGQQVLEFRKRWDCLLSADASMWHFNATPRAIGWVPQFLPGVDKLDNRWHGVYGFEINKKVEKGEYTASSWPVPPNVKYDWGLKDAKKKQCGSNLTSFSSVDGEGFCGAMARSKGSLFIVGDSLSTEFLRAFLGELVAAKVPVHKMEPTPRCAAFLKEMQNTSRVKPLRGISPFCIRFRLCSDSIETGGTELHFAISGYLWAVHDNNTVQKQLFYPCPSPFGKYSMGEGTREMVWGEEMVDHNASIVILNRGAHVAPSPLFERQLNYTITELRQMLPNLLIIYRSFYTGLPNCSRFTEPFLTPMYSSDLPHYWNTALVQNKAARSIVESVGGVYFEAQPILSLRQDWHKGPDRDCLHDLVPGPINGAVKVMSAMVMELQ